MIGLVELSGSAVAAPRPVDPSKQFDLICATHFHEYRGKTWPPLEHPRDVIRMRYVVDLTIMTYCDVGSCRDTLSSNIVSADRRRIVFSRAPYYATLRLSDGAYYDRGKEGRLVSVYRGHCRKLPFSAFDINAPAPRQPYPPEPKDTSNWAFYLIFPHFFPRLATATSYADPRNVR